VQCGSPQPAPPKFGGQRSALHDHLGAAFGGEGTLVPALRAGDAVTLVRSLRSLT